MAEAIGLASGLVTLAAFAFQASVALVKTVRSFQVHPKTVRDLAEELEALVSILGSLSETVSGTDVDLSGLNLPLLRCGKACQEFEAEIIKCSSRSGGGRTSFRDWAKIKYMGDDVDGFRQLVSGYKTTIIIALADANLRQSSVTAENVEAYRDLIKNATADLEAHLQSIDEKLEAMFGQSVTGSNSDATELQLMKEERMSTQKCLQICASLSEHIDQIQLATEASGSSRMDPDTVAERLTSDGLQECKDSLALTAAKLEGHMKDLIDRMVKKSSAVSTSEEDKADLARLRDEWDTTRRCMDICSKANIHLKENISKIENYATGDAVQFMVSTTGKTLHGKNQGLGWRTRQFGGYIDGATLQKISGDFSVLSFPSKQNASGSSNANTPSGPGDETEHSHGSEFKKYGQGFKLTPKATADTPKSTTAGAQGSSSGKERKP